MREQPKVESDEEFLARYEGKWFQPEIKKLIRIETFFDELCGSEVDSMPRWAGQMFSKVASVFDLKPSSPEMTDEKLFGKMLGAKVANALATLLFLKRLEAGDDSERLKLGKLYNSMMRIYLTFSERQQFRDQTVHQILMVLRAAKPEADKILSVRKKALMKVQSQSLVRQGRFFIGYGEGLRIFERMHTWTKTSPKRIQKTAYIHAFGFLNWPLIQEYSQKGKWADLFDEFARSLPDGVEISEDAFRQSLRRAGLVSFGKPGRPRKTMTTK